METKRVLLLGDVGHGDFRDAVQWLTAYTELVVAETVSDGVRHLLSAPPIDVAIIAQAEPDQFPVGEIERLHQASPLTRLIALLGSWCEGEVRTGRPWPGVLRIYWHQWRARMVPELTGDQRPSFALWHLPRTATNDEQLAATVRVVPTQPLGRGLIALHCQSATTFQGLRDACSLGGYASIWYPPNNAPQATGVTAAIWDGSSGDDCDAYELQAVVQHHTPAPVLVTLDFVRRQDLAAALDAGAKAVLAKPVLIADLLWQLDAAIAEGQPAQASPAA